MKTRIILGISVLCITFSVVSCKKDHGDDGLSDDIKNFVPQEIIDSMRNWGMTINEGKTPPSINGIYLFSPDYCTFDNSGSNRTGSIFNDYKYKFTDQDSKALTVKLSRKSLQGTDSASGVGAFLSGNGSSFTAFIEVNGVSSGISYNQIEFYSGEVTSSGISNFQNAIYMKSKSDDPYGKLMGVGASRIFRDNDYLSNTTETYRIVPGTGEDKPIVGAK